MKKFVNSKFFMPVVLVFIISVWVTFYHKDKVYNAYRCSTKKEAIKGLITKVDGRTGYMIIFVDNKQSYYFDIASIKYKKGFGKYHEYEVGDSVFKEANSNEALIRHGDSTCLLVLKCNE